MFQPTIPAGDFLNASAQFLGALLGAMVSIMIWWLFGMNWDEYRGRARLIAGAALLKDGRLPIGLVAAEVGFESQSAFARAFKALTDKSPRD